VVAVVESGAQQVAVALVVLEPARLWQLQPEATTPLLLAAAEQRDRQPELPEEMATTPYLALLPLQAAAGEALEMRRTRMALMAVQEAAAVGLGHQQEPLVLEILLLSARRRGQTGAQEVYLRLITVVAAVAALLRLELPEVAAQQEQAAMAPHHLFPVAASPTQVAAVVALMAIPAQIKALAAQAAVARVARLHQITV